MLPDNYFPETSPDILCQFHDLSFYVEVTSLSNSDPVVKSINELRELVNNSHFEVHVHFNDSVSKPRFYGPEHGEQETLLEKSLGQFKEKFEHITPETTAGQIETDCITFFVTPTPEKPGILVGLSSGYKFPREIFEKFVGELLFKKAIKREKFKGLARNFPYILTFVSENVAVGDNDFQQLLYGFVPSFILTPTADQEEIQNRERRWEEILRDKSEAHPEMAGD